MLGVLFSHLFLVSLFSAFEFGTSISLEQWASSLRASIAELEREPTIIEHDSKALPTLRDIRSLEEKLNLFYYQLYNPPKFVIIKKYERRLRAPVFTALSYCSEMAKSAEGGEEAEEQHLTKMAKIRDLIKGLQTDFGTLFVEIGMKKIGNCKWTSKMLACLVKTIDQTATFAQQNGSFCDMGPFEQAKSMLLGLIEQKELPNSIEQAETIVQGLIVETKIDIWLNELNAKMSGFEMPFVDTKGFFKFSTDLSAELAEIKASVCKWPNLTKKKRELIYKKIGQLNSNALKKSIPLKQKIVQKLDGLLNKAAVAFEELKSELEEAKGAEEKLKQFNRKIIPIYSDRAMHMPDQVDFALFSIWERTKRGEQPSLRAAFEQLQAVIEEQKRKATDAFGQRPMGPEEADQRQKRGDASLP